MRLWSSGQAKWVSHTQLSSRLRPEGGGQPGTVQKAPAVLRTDGSLSCRSLVPVCCWEVLVWFCQSGKTEGLVLPSTLESQSTQKGSCEPQTVRGFLLSSEHSALSGYQLDSFQHRLLGTASCPTGEHLGPSGRNRQLLGQLCCGQGQGVQPLPVSLCS